jgi:[NiFe] hydrogenase assembly HybE family chaperone
MSELLTVVRVPALRPPQAAIAAPWVDDPSSALSRHFRFVRDTRMAGLPFLNASVDVCVADCRRVDGDWLAAMVTPWSIQLVLLPGGGALWQDASSGVRCTIGLPVGELVFIGEADEASADHDECVAAFLYCPLISPLEGVVGTDAARALARDALAAALSPRLSTTEAPPDRATTLPPSPSRRAFLRGSSR